MPLDPIKAIKKQETSNSKQKCEMCKSCHKLYAYDRDRFFIKSNKLFLNCDNCPYPTFISEYTGNEVFVEVTDKIEEKITPNKSIVKILEEKKKQNLKV